MFHERTAGQSRANCYASIIDQAIGSRDSINLQHLRRFVKPAFLPLHLQDDHDRASSRDKEEGAYPPTDVLHFLVCALRTLSAEEVSSLLSSTVLPAGSAHSFHLRVVRVPLLPPSTAGEAEEWSQKYWPTNYKKNNPFGPHPSIVARATDEIESGAAYYMGLARQAGEETFKASRGLPIGAVVVNRRNPMDSVVAVTAGDARWAGLPDGTINGTGNVLGHAVMRAIALVARKRRSLAEGRPRHEADSGPMVDTCLTEIERITYTQDGLAPGGYLCLDLELYTTHEPCVMCAMAILHSRFGRLVFGERMPLTGGLAAESSGAHAKNLDIPHTSHGLFWRPDLNWKLLAWQWVEDEPLRLLQVKECHA